MARTITIGEKSVGDNEPCMIVAEIGVNHNGDEELARKMIKCAKKCGADGVKFQTWSTEEIILDDVELASYQKESIKTNSTQFAMLKKLEIPYDRYFALKEYAEELGLLFFSTMEDKKSVDFLLRDLDIPLIKVGSGDLTNYPLLKYTASLHKPMVVSTGMATLGEIDLAVQTIANEGNENIILLQCTTQYPCPYEDINLRAILTLKDAFKTVVGLSDHSKGIECAIAAVALGAKYIEKHFTLDNTLPGPDHQASLEPHEFRRVVEGIRNVEKAMGDGIKRPMASELENKNIVRRKIVAGRDILAGEVFTEENISLKRAASGLSPEHCPLIIGRRAKKDLKYNQIIDLQDII